MIEHLSSDKRMMSRVEMDDIYFVSAYDTNLALFIAEVRLVARMVFSVSCYERYVFDWRVFLQ